MPAPQSQPVDPVHHRILQAAHDRFLTLGFSRVTMDELAGELGMSKKTLYLHFPAKSDLLEAVLDLRMQSIRQLVESVVSRPDLDFAGRLQSLIPQLSRRLAEMKPPFLEDLRRHAPEAFSRVERFRQHLLETQFNRLLEEGRAQGMVRQDLNPAVVIQMLLTLVQHTVNPDAVLRLGVSPGEALETVLGVVLQGVMTTAAKTAYANTSAA